MKLPHWVQLLLALAVVVITWVTQQAASGQLVLPAVAITVLTIVKTAIGMLTDSVPTGIAQKRAARLAAGGLSAFVVLAFLAFAVGCSALPAAVQDVANIATIAIADAQKGMTPAQIVDDVVAQTGVQDLSLIAQIIGAIAADPKTPPSAVSALHAAQSLALARVARP